MPSLTLPDGGRIDAAESLTVGDDLRLGPDVVVTCRCFQAGDGVRIGDAEHPEAFRHPGGVRVRADDVSCEEGAQIGREVLIEGGRIRFGRGVQLHPATTIRVRRQLIVGDHGTVHSHAEIAGVDIEIGRYLWMLPHARIGGGSAFDVHSRLRIGDWCHLGVRSLINTARPVTIGDEVGLGTGTSLYTHGAYPSALDGKPVAYGPITIGDRSWLPGAVVNPSVTIGADCVVGVGSVVTRDLPAGCLAAGAPARVLKENVYPRPLAGEARTAFLCDFLRTFAEVVADQLGGTVDHDPNGFVAALDDDRIAWYPALPASPPSSWPAAGRHVVLTDEPGSDEWREITIVHLRGRTVRGPVTQVAERVLNQLRRYGIRFPYEARGGRYAPWK